MPELVLLVALMGFFDFFGANVQDSTDPADIMLEARGLYNYRNNCVPVAKHMHNRLQELGVPHEFVVLAGADGGRDHAYIEVNGVGYDNGWLSAVPFSAKDLQGRYRERMRLRHGS